LSIHNLSWFFNKMDLCCDCKMLPRTTSLCSYIFLVIFEHRLHVVNIWKKSPTHAMGAGRGVGRQWCGPFHSHWWKASINVIEAMHCIILSYCCFTVYHTNDAHRYNTFQWIINGSPYDINHILTRMLYRITVSDKNKNTLK